MHFFLLRCPKCGNEMKYHTASIILTGKNKRCVYCGKTFSVRKQMIKKISSEF